mmetsp:Transcript_28780/g.61785  ORF Transcript_28780/g.61785 Transcript_28780/m.61785 type:complete len:249 (-) Transcript_28780:195-941(-)
MGKAQKSTIPLSSSSLGPMKVIFKSNCTYDDNKFESNDADERWTKWNDDIAIARIDDNAGIDDKDRIGHRYNSSISALQSPLRNGVHEDNKYSNEKENEKIADQSETDEEESFTSFISTSIGSNISKSFDWALETTTMQSCQNPFEYYCIPVTPTTGEEDSFIRLQQQERQETGEKVRRISFADNSDDGEDEEDAHRPFVPFRLSLLCEYCGSPSIRNCREFDPGCRRPKTFFPKAKPPFGRSTRPDR